LVLSLPGGCRGLHEPLCLHQRNWSNVVVFKAQRTKTELSKGTLKWNRVMTLQLGMVITIMPPGKGWQRREDDVVAHHPPCLALVPLNTFTSEFGFLSEVCNYALHHALLLQLQFGLRNLIPLLVSSDVFYVLHVYIRNPQEEECWQAGRGI